MAQNRAVFDGLPFWQAFLGLFAVAMLRANATYWIGRGVRAGAARGERPVRPGVLRAEAVVSRYGAPAVALSFLTVGVQTAINLAAGALRMPVRRYLPAVTVGALIWATLYSTIGAAILEAWLGGAWRALWPALLAVTVIAAATWWVRHRVGRDSDGGTRAATDLSTSSPHDGQGADPPASAP